MKVAHITYAEGGSGASIAAVRIHELFYSTKIESIMYVDKKFSYRKDIRLFNNFFSRIVRLIVDKIFKFIFFIFNGYREQVSLNIINSDKIKIINSKLSSNIIHLHWINREMMSIKDISEIKMPVIWTLHDMWAFSGIKHYFNSNEMDYTFDSLSQKNKINYVDKYFYKKKCKLWKKPIQLTVPSKWLYDEVKKNNLTKNWPIEIIPNPLDFDIWKPINKIKARKNLGIDVDDTVICFGGLDADKDSRKGYKQFIDLINTLETNHHNDICLLIFGFDENIFYKKLKKEYKILFCGFVKHKVEMKNIYSAADIYIQPSKMETFGQTALESISCKTPVVAFNNTGISDIVKHKQTGYLARYNDYDDLLVGINWVLQNKRIIYDRDIQILKDNFSYESVSKKFIKLYAKVINEFN